MEMGQGLCHFPQSNIHALENPFKFALHFVLFLALLNLHCWCRPTPEDANHFATFVVPEIKR